MSVSRRTFVRRLAGGVAATALPSFPGRAAGVRGTAPLATRPVRAILFDAFPVFDPRPIAALAEHVFPGRGAELMAAWRTRQFEYTWLRTLTGTYVDFWQCTEDALRYAAALLRLALAPAQREQLMGGYLALRQWPDAPAALRALRAAGVRLGIVSNFTPTMLEAAVRGGALEGVFEHVLSTDRARAFKPHPRAYQLGLDALGLPRDDVLFAAFARWDAVGAKRFGYRTYWVNRLQAPAEELGSAPDGTGSSLAELVTFVRAAG